MARKKYDLIVFDWDGTLMDSTTTIVRAIQAAARDVDVPIPSVQSASYVIGLGLHDAIQTAMPGLDAELYPRIVERFAHHYRSQSNDLILFDGVREMLADLSNAGYFLAVATGKSSAGLARVLESTKLSSVFDATRCADQTFSKPNPAMLLELTRELGQELGRTLMIGDTTHDLLMASNAGADAVAVNYGAHSVAALEELRPLYVASSVRQLHDWLREHG